MRPTAFIFMLLAVSLAAQDQPNCSNSITREVDARCACVRDPGSQLCEMVKKGFYDTNRDFTKGKGINLNPAPGYVQPSASQASASQSSARRAPIRALAPAGQPARPRQARVVPLATKDYLRFLDPNAQVAAGVDIGKFLRSRELMQALFGEADGEGLAAAVGEMDHLWISFAAPENLIVLATGRFERGAAAGLFYSQGIQPVFLGGAGAMMIGSEPSIQGALARLAKPAASSGWVARRARELARDHDTWIVNQPSPDSMQGAAGLRAIRQVALGFRLNPDSGLDGEAVTDSEASAQSIATWIETMKTTLRGGNSAGPLDSLAVRADGLTLRFSAKGDSLMAGEAGKAAMNSDFAVELYSVIMAGFPGMPARTVAADKLLAVRPGMKREEVLGMLGRPLSVSSIQGLDTPRETWTYQIPFGKQLSLRLDDGIVTAAPR